ncbi:MAG TPA: hypothetical protein VKF81_10465 [Blastocatellia bacterium]|nr:hypothetical protein [Blastocatellia bacterium]
MSTNAPTGYTRTAAVGFILIVTPLLFVCAAVLRYGFNFGLLFDPFERLLSDPGRLAVFNIISPVLFLGALLLAIVLNLRAIARLRMTRDQGHFIATIRFTPKLPNIGIIALSAMLIATIVIYAFLENFTRPR